MRTGTQKVNPDECFGFGLLLGQIVTHCEHIKAGGKLAAQIGCDRKQLAIALDAIKNEGCRSIVDSQDSPDRVAIWVYSKTIAESLIAALNNKNSPSRVDVVIAGKLFGYADNEIEDYVTGKAAKAIFESESNQHCDSSTDG